MLARVRLVTGGAITRRGGLMGRRPLQLLDDRVVALGAEIELGRKQLARDVRRVRCMTRGAGERGEGFVDDGMRHFVLLGAVALEAQLGLIERQRKRMGRVRLLMADVAVSYHVMNELTHQAR